MSALKQLRLRINGVKSTEKITKAMKMISASRLTKAQEAKEHGKPYADKMYNTVAHLSTSLPDDEDLPALLIGNGKSQTHLLVVVSSDRGLCGGYNSIIARSTLEYIKSLTAANKNYKILCVGKKAYDQLKLKHQNHIIGVLPAFGKSSYSESGDLATKIIALFDEGAFDVCSFIYTEFLNAMKQISSIRKLIPMNEGLGSNHFDYTIVHNYEYEPNKLYMLENILPLNLGVQIYYIALESIASEHGARMTAMDAATKNSKEMIDKLTLKYNRTRQALITRELIEIISSAEVV